MGRRGRVDCRDINAPCAHSNTSSTRICSPSSRIEALFRRAPAGEAGLHPPNPGREQPSGSPPTYDPRARSPTTWAAPDAPPPPGGLHDWAPLRPFPPASRCRGGEGIDPAEAHYGNQTVIRVVQRRRAGGATRWRRDQLELRRGSGGRNVLGMSTRRAVFPRRRTRSPARRALRPVARDASAFSYDYRATASRRPAGRTGSGIPAGSGDQLRGRPTGPPTTSGRARSGM